MKRSPHKGRIRVWITDALGALVVFAMAYLFYVLTP